MRKTLPQPPMHLEPLMAREVMTLAWVALRPAHFDQLCGRYKARGRRVDLDWCNDALALLGHAERVEAHRGGEHIERARGAIVTARKLLWQRLAKEVEVLG